MTSPKALERARVLEKTLKGKEREKKTKGAKDGNKITIADETDLNKVLQACKKARNMVSSAKEDLEMALEKAEGQLSKTGQGTASTLLNELGKAFGKLKTCLTGKDPNIKKLKGILMDVAKVIKSAKEETKELKLLLLAAEGLANEFGKAQAKGRVWQMSLEKLRPKMGLKKRGQIYIDI